MPEYPLLAEAGLLIVYANLKGPKGSRLIRLALDTGATTTMIPPQAAVAIGVNPTASRPLRETLTASGKEYIPLVVIPTLKLFESVMSRVTVACHELPPESPVDGLLGLDLLTRLSVVIDLTKPSIRVR